MENNNILPLRRKTFNCKLCEVVFTQKSNLQRHERVLHKKNTFSCDICSATFGRKDNLKRHVLKDHKYVRECEVCSKTFYKKSQFLSHNKTHTLCGREENDIEEPVDLENMDVDDETSPCTSEDPCGFTHALNGVMKTYKFQKTEVGRDVLLFLAGHQELLQSKLFKDLAVFGGVKWYIAMFVRFIRESEGEEITTSPCFRSKCYTLLQESEFDEQFNDAFSTINKACTNFQRDGSNWNVEHVYYMELKTAKYTPLSASSYIMLPRQLQVKKAIVNVKNSDKKCFLWSILAQLHPQESNSDRVNKYKNYEQDLNMSGIEYPVNISKIGVFEKHNNISINVFGYENEIFPLRITTLTQARHHVNLLYLSNEDTTHYCLIKNLNRLLASLTKHHPEAHYCNLCLHRFSSKARLDNHHTYCNEHEPQKIKMPDKEKSVMEFKNHNFSQRVPFIIYADFECYIKKISGCSPSGQESYTSKLALHEPSGFCYVVINSEGQCHKPPVTYRGPHVVDMFLKSLISEEEELMCILKDIKPIIMSFEDECHFRDAELCIICEQPLFEDRVRDHNHLTGVYRGPAHNACNINCKQVTFIPVVFHNLRNYDAHLIMQHIGDIAKTKITCIPNNMEKYVSFSMGTLRFIDSYQFLGTSLETLVNNLLGYGIEKFHIMNQNFAPDKISLLLRKGIFPYDYVDSIDKFDETCLPPQSAFFNILTGETVSDADYQHATQVWDEFNLDTLGKYQDLYVKTDVLLLADIFENFRELCLTHYKIDPAHNYTAPGLAWQSCLKMTNVKLDLLTDPDMYLFMEEGIRGGVAMISTRYAEGNNKYMAEYDPAKPSNYIVYWDCNNLYGVAMNEFLPVGDFNWLTSEQIEQTDFEKIPDNAERGFILEVDLEYPVELHDLHNELPVAPERKHITDDMLSAYSKQLAVDMHVSTSRVQKLVPNLSNKVKYILHYRNLKQYISLGLKVVKIHRVLEFEQRAWLKPYIDFNTLQRQNANSSFERDLFKLLNNAVFGKTMENLRNRVNVELVNDEKRAKKLIASPAFESFLIFSNNLVAIHSKKPCLELNRPIYVGFTILDLSKTTIYDFHYNYVKTKYGNKSRLLFTDTDSLCYSITTDDLYRDMMLESHRFDTSNFPKSHFLYSEKNKKVLGKMKDELDGRVVTEFVGLRPKMYSIKDDCGNVKKVGKGIVKRTLNKHVFHNDYKKCLFLKEIQNANMYSIRSVRHEVFTLKQQKQTLSPYDDKRYILNDGVNTLAHGHYKIKKKTE